MAKESSFDVVSTVDIQEADNAYQQASRELSQRYDLKQTGATLTFSKGEGTFTLTAPSEFVASQVRDVLAGKLAKRGIDLASLRWADPQPSSGGGVRQAATLVQGIDKETAKRISKDVRDLKLKCKATVEGDKLRSRLASTALQQSHHALRANDYGQPLQFENYR